MTIYQEIRPLRLPFDDELENKYQELLKSFYSFLRTTEFAFVEHESSGFHAYSSKDYVSIRTTRDGGLFFVEMLFNTERSGETITISITDHDQADDIERMILEKSKEATTRDGRTFQEGDWQIENRGKIYADLHIVPKPED